MCRAAPVMAVVRVRVPGDVTPSVVAALVTRALAEDPDRPITAELERLPSLRPPGRRWRRIAFVAVLLDRDGSPPAELARVARRCTRRAVRERFGPEAKAQVRPATAPEELAASWYAFRGTPHRRTA